VWVNHFVLALFTYFLCAAIQIACSFVIGWSAPVALLQRIPPKRRWLSWARKLRVPTARYPSPRLALFSWVILFTCGLINIFPGPQEVDASLRAAYVTAPYDGPYDPSIAGAPLPPNASYVSLRSAVNLHDDGRQPAPLSERPSALQPDSWL